MRNDNEIRLQLLQLGAASDSFTKQALNRIAGICDLMLEEDLPANVREKLAEIDRECCCLLRNRLLLNCLAEGVASDSSAGKNCSFAGVYANCCRTVKAICDSAGKEFSFSEFLPEYELSLPANKLVLLILLPVALAFEHDPDAGVRLIASRKGKRIELEFTVSGKMPPVAELAEECRKTDRSSGLFFTEPLLALTLTETAAVCGAALSVDKNKISISLRRAETPSESLAAPESYIDNRFSLPYIVLAGIVRREI